MADPGDTQDPFEAVQAVVAEPGASADRLPSLVELLDDDDRTGRLAGAFALCLIAVADPESLPAVLGRLSDRLEADNAEAQLAVEYLARAFPKRVDAELATDSVPTAVDQGRVGGGPADDSRAEDVGRVRPPKAGFDPRNVDPNRSVIDPADPQRHDDPAQGPPGSGPNAPEGAVPERTGGADASVAERRQWNRLFERLSEIVSHSRFEELMMLSGQQRGRYADVARVLTVDEGVERALAMRLFYQPSSADSSAFLGTLGSALDRWQGVSDHPGIATVYDWNRAPQPWAATDLLETTVADRVDALSPPRAVSIAIDVADALAYAHNHGVVHGGLDPRNVGVPSFEDEADDTTARLINVGLLEVYRYHVTPASCLDPRYAAPEYYDRQFGQVDHATDVYHLGAVLYRLLTGRPPFLGEFEAIREDVLNAAPPQPSLQVDVPDAVDSVISKAMAKRSLRRYETINDLRQDLTRVHDELTGHDGTRGSDRP